MDIKRKTYTFNDFIEIVRRLRRECPWDREQTPQTLKRFFIEEVYEVGAAIDEGDEVGYKEELGDVLLHVLMHAVIAEERGAFTFDDVADAVAEKLVRRHPHVFGDMTIEEAQAVIANWEKLKGDEDNDRLLLDGIPRGLPAMLKAHRMQDRVRTVGFDWEDPAGVLNKLEEELAELRAEQARDDKDGVKKELGDMLFSLVNLCRYLDIDPQAALNGTNNEFARRFNYVEKVLKAQGRSLQEATLTEMEELWEEAKNG
jgi:MazG family protein